MKIAFIGLLALLPSALAQSKPTCTRNEDYCGSYLIRTEEGNGRGWDPAVLENQIKHSDHVPHDAPVENVLFHCSADGLAVATAEYCECRCVETGEGGENDYCSPCF